MQGQIESKYNFKKKSPRKVHGFCTLFLLEPFPLTQRAVLQLWEEGGASSYFFYFVQFT